MQVILAYLTFILMLMNLNIYISIYIYIYLDSCVKNVRTNNIVKRRKYINVQAG